jgi:hypothetical protein
VSVCVQDTAQTGRSRATEATARMGTEAGNVGSRGNADAERVLTRIRQKLDGYEDGELLSISGQVSGHSLKHRPTVTNGRNG